MKTENSISRNFQSFENAAPAVSAAPTQAPYSNVPPAQFGGSFLDPSQAAPIYGQEFGQEKTYTGNEFDDEPPLLEGQI